MSADAARWASLSCSESHCVATASDGTAWTWSTTPNGNRFGQLCRKTDRVGHSEPGRVDLPPAAGAVVAAAAGGRRDSGHSLLLTAEGRVYSCGCNRWTQLGSGLYGWTDGGPYSRTPAEVVALRGFGRATHIAAGGDHSLVAVEDGGVVGFGRGHRGQLPTGKIQNAAAVAPEHLSGEAWSGTVQAVVALDDCSGVVTSESGSRQTAGGCPDETVAAMFTAAARCRQQGGLERPRKE